LTAEDDDALLLESSSLNSSDLGSESDSGSSDSGSRVSVERRGIRAVRWHLFSLTQGFAYRDTAQLAARHWQHHL